MAGIPISSLPAVASALSTDYLPVVQGGVTSKETLAQINTLLQTILVTPANGGVLYTDASQIQLLAPTSTAHQMFMSGASSAPSWSTATYPVTTTINQLLYSSANNTLAGLATANSSTLVTDGSGVPSLSQTLPSAVQTNITALGSQAQALNMNSHLINNVTDPVSAQDSATKNYVDTLIAAVASVFVAKVATTGALTVTYNNGTSGIGATLTNAGAQAALSIDGVSLSVGNLVLVKDQASATQNGYYSVTNIGSVSTNWVMTRSTLYDQPSEILPGDLFVITSGTANANTSWIQTATVTTIGSDNITFSQYSVALPIPVSQGGTGLTSLTAHNLIIGNGTSNATLLAPGATSGVALISQGASADPAYGTVVVGGGGTGLTTTTAYGLITGGTTATGNFQNAGTGNSGDIYVSGGSAALGTWTAPTGTGSPVKATSPTLVTPALGTPASGVLTNCTGLTASGVASNSGGGIPVQVQQGQLTSTTSIATSTATDTGVTVSITPTSSSSKILVRAFINFAINLTDVGYLQLVRGSTAIGIGDAAGSRTQCTSSSLVANSATDIVPFTLEWLDSPATTSSTTYKVQAWTNAGSQSYINRTVTDTNSAVYPRTVSTITVMEIK